MRYICFVFLSKHEAGFPFDPRDDPLTLEISKKPHDFS
jgi:hypothetical protein